MNLRQLEAFHEVMVSGTVSGAARNMGRTQPAVSALIAGLEDMLGYKLFERRSGRLHPVPEAHFLFEEMREVFERLDKLKRTMQAVRDLERGSVRIASMQGPALFFLPGLISRFIKDRPDVNTTLLSLSSLEVQLSVAAQQFDIGLIDLGVEGIWADSTLVDTTRLVIDCVCALPAGHDLAAKARITPQDLDGRPIGALFQGHALRKAIEAAFTEAATAMTVCFETQIFVPHFTLVEEGAICSIVDPISAASYCQYRGDKSGIVFRPFDPAIPFEIGIITPTYRPRSRLTTAFLTAITNDLEHYAESWKSKAP